MSIIIEESGMRFGPYHEDDVFHIERCELYKCIQTNLKMCEFVLHRTTEDNKPSYWILEAKSSSPNPSNNKKFSEYITNITEKMDNALLLLFALMLKRHPEHSSQLPPSFAAKHIPSCSIRFVLVLPDHPKRALEPIQLALNKALDNTLKIWNLGANSVVVLNNELAVRHALIME